MRAAQRADGTPVEGPPETGPDSLPKRVTNLLMSLPLPLRDERLKKLTNSVKSALKSARQLKNPPPDKKVKDNAIKTWFEETTEEAKSQDSAAMNAEENKQVVERIIRGEFRISEDGTIITNCTQASSSTDTWAMSAYRGIRAFFSGRKIEEQRTLDQQEQQKYQNLQYLCEAKEPPQETVEGPPPNLWDRTVRFFTGIQYFFTGMPQRQEMIRRWRTPYPKH